MKANLSLKLAILLAITLNPLYSIAYEMQGLISYNLGQLSPKPTSFTSTSNGIGYTFLAKMDLGPGLLETGFQFVPTSITTQQTFGELKATGSYWILPIMYRYVFLPPFFSIGIGADYAVVGTNNLSVGATQVNGLTTGFKGHFGAQISLAMNQDLGEDLSAVLDFRYRAGLSSSINFGTEESKYNFFIIGLGIQKHLE